MITSDTCLLDTNILVYAADETSPFHQDAKVLREKGINGEVSLCICPQVLSEYFAIITDPKRVNEPRTQKEAVFEMEKYYSSKNILKIYPGSGVMEKTLDLLKRYNITKQTIFDLQLVATMLSNNVTNIYTLNQADFSKFIEIEVLTP
ncbi:MAG: PIN domain-containing protein [Candidatus Brocadiaceae bacterium]|nr:PIN domain-containing protein [Candidatus Brocadiaceae bacterium]